MPERPEDAGTTAYHPIDLRSPAKDEDMEDNAAKPASLLKRLTDPNFISRLMQLFLSGRAVCSGRHPFGTAFGSTWNLIMLVFVSHK